MAPATIELSNEVSEMTVQLKPPHADRDTILYPESAGYLRFFDEATGKRLLTDEEARQQAEEARQQAEDRVNQVEDENARLREELARLSDEFKQTR